MPAPQGPRVGRYVLSKLVARGGMAELYLAWEDMGGGRYRKVGLKRILPSLAADEEFVEMFFREARLGAMVCHDAVTEIFELAKHGETHFIAMEFLEGRDLRQVLAQRELARAPVEPGVLAGIGARVAHGLAAAHAVTDPAGTPIGLVHRDVTPENVFLCADGAVKLLDFGIAKAAASANVTRGSKVKGKLGYMSPECFRGEKLDGRHDVFSLGVLLFRALAGELPYAAANEMEVIDRVVRGRPTPLAQLAPRVPAALATAVDAALVQDRARRPDAAAFAARLEACASPGWKQRVAAWGGADAAALGTA